MNLRLVAGTAMVLSMLLVSCDSPPTTTTADTDSLTSAQATVDALAAAQPSGGIPPHFRSDTRAEIVRGEGDFDVNAYFGVLTHLSAEPGWVIDYLYQVNGMGGSPFVYARPADHAPYTSFDEYAAATDEGQAGATGERDYSRDYLGHIRIDDTREGYFQFVALMMMGDQFYLLWHAGYNDRAIVADKEALEKTISAAGSAFENSDLPANVQERARQLDLTPAVAFPDDSTAIVRVVTFTMWGGFIETAYTISRRFPHTILGQEAKILIEYDCGVQF
jgi:hypothetical protein